MTPTEYEKHVSAVVRRLKVAKGAKVYRNRRFPGIRQPGEYEVDVALEAFLGNKIFFRLIVECKKWGRPVTRPEVQKLIQTRDAIGAHKAALVSPVGFSREAIEVARANGVALWIIAKRKWIQVEALRFFTAPLDDADFYDLRRHLIRTVVHCENTGGLVLAAESSGRFGDTQNARRAVSPMVVDIEAEGLCKVESGIFERELYHGSAAPGHGYDEFLDPVSARAWVAQWIIEALASEDSPGRARLASWQEATASMIQLRGLSEEDARRAAGCVIRNDVEGFLEGSREQW